MDGFDILFTDNFSCCGGRCGFLSMSYCQLLYRNLYLIGRLKCPLLIFMKVSTFFFINEHIFHFNQSIVVSI